MKSKHSCNDINDNLNRFKIKFSVKLIKKLFYLQKFINFADADRKAEAWSGFRRRDADIIIKMRLLDALS